MNLQSFTPKAVAKKAAKSPGLKTWEKRVAQYEAGTPITESLIIALRSALRRGQHDLRMFLCGGVIVNCVKWNITKEQSGKGISWLLRRDVQKNLTEECRAIVDSFSHFTFEGVAVERHLYRESFFPIYRVHSTDGKSFAYSSAPWQSNEQAFNVIEEVAK